jgi:signal transduction histidine kinase
LDLSKVEAGHIEITKEEVDLTELMQSSFENHLPVARERKISIVGAVPPLFPSSKATPDV